MLLLPQLLLEQVLLRGDIDYIIPSLRLYDNAQTSIGYVV